MYKCSRCKEFCDVVVEDGHPFSNCCGQELLGEDGEYLSDLQCEVIAKIKEAQQ